jgi:hypothetical protein
MWEVVQFIGNSKKNSQIKGGVMGRPEVVPLAKKM